MELPESDFYTDKNRPDGRYPYCKKCSRAKEKIKREKPEAKGKARERGKRYYWRHKDEIRAGRKAYESAYYARKSEIVKEKNRKWRAENQQKILEYAAKSKEKNREKKRLAQRDYYRRNKEKVLAYQREYNIKNKDAIRERSKIYARKNRQSLNEYVRRWGAEHPDAKRGYYLKRKYRDPDGLHEIQRAAKSKRRARMAGNGGGFTPKEWKALKDRYYRRCLCCGLKEPEIKLAADHVIPIKDGGTSDISNIQPLCMSCNKKKSTKYVDYRFQWVCP